MKENWRALGELAGGSGGTGAVGEEILSGRESQRQAGRIRAVQWEASPKGGMEGVTGAVDKMSRL